MININDDVKQINGNFEGEVIDINYNKAIVYNKELDREKEVMIWNLKKN